jgi:hypothetical protein
MDKAYDGKLLLTGAIPSAGFLIVVPIFLPPTAPSSFALHPHIARQKQETGDDVRSLSAVDLLVVSSIG